LKEHHYRVQVQWNEMEKGGTSSYKSYSRNHTIWAEGKQIIPASSDPSFLGNKQRYNPEELFVGSLASCHMLWYLHLCTLHGITVVKYSDSAEGLMKEEIGGKGRFESVTLLPKVTILEMEKKDRALDLHNEANRLCFIANSCNFEVIHRPVILINEQ
jgi:organic hydroperoxide reductase OsmC/OhrA